MSLYSPCAAGTRADAETLIERGSYLVNALMACDGCHAPRGPRASRWSGGFQRDDTERLALSQVKHHARTATLALEPGSTSTRPTERISPVRRLPTSLATECSMSGEQWPYFAGVASIILAVFFAYLLEGKCQRDLAFQRSFPSALSELIVGSEPIRCWFNN